MTTRARIQIIATIGPASGAEELLGNLVKAGMDIARLNFSHGSHEEHAVYIERIRRIAGSRGARIPIIQDLSGPRGTSDGGHAFDAGQAEITEKDLWDLDFGVAQRVDYIAQSYVGSAADITAMRARIAERGAAIPLIAKIERRVALENADEIIAAADAILIARGDLGQEMPIEQIPFIEKDLIARCNRAGKPVITATQMMLSMVTNLAPTRAEVTDVAYSIICGTDAGMLSEETARGEHPVETVRAMENIALEAEKHMPNTVRNVLL